jgi:hypothetical protein
MFLLAFGALAIVNGATSTIAQVDPNPGDATIADDSMPTSACPPPPPADVPVDEEAPPAAGPICTPTPGADIPPSTLPTDTATPLAADTPVPTPVPDTPTPRPTEAPPPTLTNTPTPEPPQPTATPTSTSASKNVPAGTLLKQLPFAAPGETECELIFGAGQQSCPDQDFPATVTFSISGGSASNDPISIVVDDRPPETATNFSWDFVSAPGRIPTGSHTITATQGSGASKQTARATLNVRRSTNPRFLVYPRSASAGSKVQVWLAGFPANSDQRLGLYRQKPNCTQSGNDCYDLANDQGIIKIGGDGTFGKTIQVPGNDPTTAHYLVATANLQISSKDPTAALQALGKPWFAVKQP